MNEQKLLGIDTNKKTIKGREYGYMTGVVYLAPVKSAGGPNVCPHASAGCAKACLFTVGRGRGSLVRNARIRKTREFHENQDLWLKRLAREIGNLIKNAAKKNLTPCVRLNGTSDIPWERIKFAGKSIMQHFPKVQFYDYTKSFRRMRLFLRGDLLPDNYHLTFSRSESNHNEVTEILRLGGNVAVVFKDELPTHWNGYSVTPGDTTDLRFLDDKNVIVGLSTKGRAKHDKLGFVVAGGAPAVTVV